MGFKLASNGKVLSVKSTMLSGFLTIGGEIVYLQSAKAEIFDVNCLILPPQNFSDGLKRSTGAVAQLVEQRTENPCVGGSIPPHTTSENDKPL